MGRRDEVLAELKASRQPDWIQDRKERLQGVGGLVGAVGRGLMGEPSPLLEKTATSRRLTRVYSFGRMTEIELSPEQRAKDAAAEMLGKLTRPQIEALARAIVPGVAEWVGEAWDLMLEMTYERGSQRKPFRARDRTELFTSGRGAWMQSVLFATEGHPEADLAFILKYREGLGRSEWTADADITLIGLMPAAAQKGGKSGDWAQSIMMEAVSAGAASGDFGPWVIKALLRSPRAEGWELLAGALKAAQRQEGLRQAILESADVGQSGAFLRILRTVEEERMGRFASVVRAVDVWAGLLWDSAASMKVEETISTLRRMCEDDGARAAALESKDAEAVYFALWATAFDNAPAAVAPAQKLLTHKDVAHRWVGAHVLGLLALPETRPLLLAAVRDPDPRVAGIALMGLDRNRWERAEATSAEQYDAMAVMVAAMEQPGSAKVANKPLVWPWAKTVVKVEVALERMMSVGTLAQAIQLYDERRKTLPADARSHLAYRLKQEPSWKPEFRQPCLALLEDPSSAAREGALDALETAKIVISDEEAETLAKLLSRKSVDLRKGVLGLLAGQAPKDALASAESLLEAGGADMRLGGLELLAMLAKSGHRDEAKRVLAENRPAKLGEIETRLVGEIEGTQTQAETVTLRDGLGLMKGRERSKVRQPRTHPDVRYTSDAADALLTELDTFIETHREYEMKLENGETMPLGGMGSIFPRRGTTRLKTDTATGPDLSLFKSFWANRKHRDPDGLELLRMEFRLAAQEEQSYWPLAQWARDLLQDGRPKLEVQYESIISRLLLWFETFEEQKGWGPALARMAENLVARGPAPKKAEASGWSYGRDWKTAWSDVKNLVGLPWHGLPEAERISAIGDWWAIETWHDEPAAGVPREPVSLQSAMLPWEHGFATDGDLIDLLIVDSSLEEKEKRLGGSGNFGDLRMATDRRQRHLDADWHRGLSKIRPLVDEVVARVVEVECARAEASTPATRAARALQHSGGLNTVSKALKCLGKSDLKWGGHGWADDATANSRAAVMTHLLDVSSPLPGETPSEFAKSMKTIGPSEEQLVGLAVLNPGWAAHVEKTLEWPGLEDAVWWVYAHTRGAVKPWGEGEQVLAELAKRTPVDAKDLGDGAVDVAWFHRVVGALGKKRWAVVDSAAKHASGGGTGHARARLFADALLGEVSRKELIERITKKRFQDAVRAVGLVAIKDGEPGRKDVAERYKIIQEFLRTSKQFGGQRQASEKRAAAIGMDNLARTAGYRDPIRLQWAMETNAVADLADGPVVVKVGEVSVSLAVADGEVSLVAEKKGKALATIPPAVKKDGKVAVLVERKTELTRSATRMRLSLETAMARGDVFEGRELKELWGNVILRPMLERLVFLGEGIAGYPASGGRVLLDFAGNKEPVKAAEKMRLAHPVDLLGGKAWSKWQKECLASERVQPFKQVFRELYLPTAAEKGELRSRRYAGQQVHPKQALALLGGRGWVFSTEDGVRKTLHAEGISIGLGFQEHFYTPAEVDGVTLEEVHFARRGKEGSEPSMTCGDVPARVFSEAMRDLDLVVSVAHRGGVDPEASQSTVEMRAALVTETATLLGLKNVKVKERHVFIDGTLARYSVHLGSAEAHLVPGGALPIVAVHSQHRGRVFLPFADADPKTAEVVSKVLLLARDEDIRDPALAQAIRSRG